MTRPSFTLGCASAFGASLAISALCVVEAYGAHPGATAAFLALFAVGGGFASVRYPSAVLGHSVVLGAVIGVFVGAALLLGSPWPA